MYLRFLALFYSIARPGPTVHYGAAVLVSVPQFSVIGFSLLALAVATGFSPAYVPLLVVSLAVGFAIFEVNARILKTHRAHIEGSRRGKRPAWGACAALYALAYAYVALVVVLAR